MHGSMHLPDAATGQLHSHTSLWVYPILASIVYAMIRVELVSKTEGTLWTEN